MNWNQDLVLEDGQTRTVGTDLTPIEVSLKGDTLTYRRQEYEDHESDSTVEKTFLMEGVRDRVRLSFRPVYPDRPVVFEPEDDLSVPCGQNGFFCLSVRMGVGIRIKRTDTLVEELLPRPRKNSYWGPPHNGLLSYRVVSSISTDPSSLVQSTDRATAVVPVYYLNRRQEGDAVTQCLVPLDELDIYRNPEGDLIFEVVQLTQSEEFYQEPDPLKRPPREMKTDLDFFLGAPVTSRSLFEKVREMPRLDSLTSMLLKR